MVKGKTLLFQKIILQRTISQHHRVIAHKTVTPRRIVALLDVTTKSNPPPGRVVGVGPVSLVAAFKNG